MSKISIRMIIDVVSALEAKTLHGSLFMFDDRRLAGSQFQGTDHLHSAVAPEDQIIWLPSPIECEVYMALTEIDIPSDICEVSSHTYEDTDILYWTGVVRKPVGSLPYRMTFEVGNQKTKMTTNYTHRLINAL